MILKWLKYEIKKTETEWSFKSWIEWTWDVSCFGTPGCCQCGCNYEGKPGGSSTSANDSANNAHGYTSDGSHPCCSTTDPKPEFPKFPDFPVMPQDALCGATQGHSCGIWK